MIKRPQVKNNYNQNDLAKYLNHYLLDLATDISALQSSGGGGGSVTDGDKGDITVSAGGTIWSVDNNVVNLSAGTRTATDFSVNNTKGTGVSIPLVDIANNYAGLMTKQQSENLDYTYYGYIESMGISKTSTNNTVIYANTVSGSLGSYILSAASSTFAGLLTSANFDIIAKVPTSTIKGRITAGIGVQEDLTGTQATTLLDTFTSGLKGLAPPSGGGTTNYLRADGTWAAPASGGGNKVIASVDFGASFTDKASIVVTGQTWVAASSVIIPKVLTPGGVDPDEMYLLDIKSEISDIVVGTGFTVTLYSEPEAKGTYSVMCMGLS